MRLALSSTIVLVRSSRTPQSMRLPHARSGGFVGCVGPLARSTFYPCRHAGRTPYATCAVERVAANPLQPGAPSLRTVSQCAHPGQERAPGPVVHAATVVSCCAVARVSVCGLRPLWLLQLRSLGDHAVLEVAPQRDQQPARERHNADAAHALAACGKTAVEPLSECAVRLIAQPVPGDLHQQCAHAAIARLADALLALAIADVVGTGIESHAASQLTPVAEPAPAKHLAHQHPGALQAERAQLEQAHQWAALPEHRFHLLFAHLFHRQHLLPYQLLTHALARDLGPQRGGHLLLELLQALTPAAPAYPLQAHVVQHRQRTNAIHVGVALALQA